MSNLKDKLYNYELTPPENAWEKISTALDESNMSDEFPTKLYNTEVTPPATTWDRIITALDAENPVVRSMPRRNYSLFRYAAAAAVIGFIAFGIIKWAGGNNGKSDIAISKESVPGKTEIIPDENNTTEKEITPAENDTYIAANDQKKKTRQKKNYSVSDNIDQAEPIYAYNELTPNIADRYIMLMTPAGNIIRMSKKCGDLVCCVSGEDQDKDCKDQLKKWQEKLATSPATSTGNFMDILSLVSSLDNEL